jgi:FkbM family methyltransferase
LLNGTLVTPRRSLVAARHFVKRHLYRLLPVKLQEEIDFRFYLRRLRAGTQVQESELQLLHHFVNSGTVAVDVGANLGGYAIALCDLVGPAGAVHAFEPVPRTFRLLRRSAAILGKNIRIHRLAVSNAAHVTRFYVPVEGRLENFYVASLIRPSQNSIEFEVRTTTLDFWRQAQSQRVSFIKIDAEGAEFDVLSGARALLASDQPIVLCEISGGRPPAERDVFALMRQLDYCSFQQVGERLVPRHDVRNRNGPNFIFVPCNRVDMLGRLIGD